MNARSQPPDLSVLDVWCRVFGITVSGALRQTDEVIQGLKLLLDEVELVTAQVKTENYGDPARYGSTLSLIDMAIDKVNFSAQWQHNKGHLDRVNYDLLGTLSDLTPDEERVQDKALGEFAEELQKFKQYALENLEGQFQTFVLEQIAIMERAIKSYPIVGAKAFRAGVTDSYAHWAANYDVYTNSDNQQAKGEFRATLKKFLSLAPEWVVKGAQVVNAVDTMRQLTGN